MSTTKVKLNAPNQPVFYIGTSGWTYEHWKGSFYPADLPKKSWFDYYASHFSAVEVNATFYQIFKDDVFQKWSERAPHGFRYVLKAPRLITHQKFLIDVEEDIKAFYRSCVLLEDKFEMILLQVAPHLPYDLERLQKALLAFPEPGRVAVEFRRPEWLNPNTLGLLREVGATICIADSPQQTLSTFLTSNRAYIRLHGRKHWYSYNYSAGELREIANLAQELAGNGANKVYIFFNNDFEGFAPANALAMYAMLSEA